MCSVTLARPQEFFGLFASSNTTKKSQKFWISKSVKKVENCNATESAFNLLQWAEYGDVPAVLSSGASEKKHDDDGDEDDSGADKEIMDETDFAAETVTDPSKEHPMDMFRSDVTVEETPDPLGLQNGVVLRPYQRQALSWMMKREDENPPSGDQVFDLQLLSEVAGARELFVSKPSQHTDLYRLPEISCDCGPVRVSEEGARQAKCLGQRNSPTAKDPVQHPLWKRRFLATEGMESVVSFYVSTNHCSRRLCPRL